MHTAVGCAPSARFCLTDRAVVVPSIEDPIIPDEHVHEIHMVGDTTKSADLSFDGLANDTSGPEAIGCASATFCLVASASLAFTWDGHQFAFTFGFFVGDPVGLACPDVHHCVAAVAPNAAIPSGRLDVYDADQGFIVNSVDPPAPPGQIVTLHDLSCGGPQSCVAVGSVGPPGAANPSPYIVQGDGLGHWSVPSMPISGPGTLRSVSCPNSSECVAIGDGTVNGTHDGQLAVARTGGQWFVAPDTPATSGGFPVTYDRIGCGGTTCQALGHVLPPGPSVAVAALYQFNEGPNPPPTQPRG
jgi:hypothetical protein